MWLILQSWDCKPLLGLGVLRVDAWLHLCSGDERREAKVAPTYCVGELGELAPKFRATGDWGATQGGALLVSFLPDLGEQVPGTEHRCGSS